MKTTHHSDSEELDVLGISITIETNNSEYFLLNSITSMRVSLVAVFSLALNFIFVYSTASSLNIILEVFMFLKVFSTALLTVSVLSFASQSFADDKIATENLAKASELYQQRDVVDANGKYINILTAIETLKTASTNAEDEDLKFDIAILTSRCHYWLAQHATEKNSKISLFQAAMETAKQAQAINDEYAEGFYYYGIALGRWAEANGVTESLGRKDELMQSMKESKIRPTREDAKGETIDGMGPDRILGRVYYKLPFFAGGSRSESLKYLSNAYSTAPKFFINGIYYAETLSDGGSKAEVAQACQILKEISSKKPEDGLLTRIPENKEDIVDAQKAFQKICQ